MINNAIYLEYLVLRGFRSFKQETRIEFPKTGLFLINSINYDTNGKSASGKSTIPLGISFILDCCPFSAKDLQNWDENSPKMNVKLGLLKGADKIEISKGEEPYISVNGIITVQGASAVKKEVQNLFFGFDSEVIKSLTYRPQRKFGLFLSKTDLEKKEFLTGLLKLGKIEEAIEFYSDKIKVLEETIKKHDINIEVFNNSLSNIVLIEPVCEDYSNLKKECDDLELTINNFDKVIENEKSKIEMFNEQISDYKKQSQEHNEIIQNVVKSKNEDLSKVLFEEFNKNNGKLEVLQAEINQHKDSLDRKNQEIIEKGSTLQKIKMELEKIPLLKKQKKEAKISLLKVNQELCPTCEQAVNKDKTEELKFQIEKTISTLNEQIEVLELRQHDYDRVAEDIRKLSKDAIGYSDMVAKTTNEKKLLEELLKSEYQNKQKEVKLIIDQKYASQESELNMISGMYLDYIKKFEDLIKECQDKISDSNRTIHLLQNSQQLKGFEISNIINRYEYAKKEYADKKKLVDDFKLKIKKEELERNKSTIEVSSCKDFIELIGRKGFLGYIFEEILNEISDSTNSALASIPNVSQCTINFKTETENSKGEAKKKISPEVCIRGHIAPLDSGCSGGMQSAIEIAVDLAVSDVISKRNGCNIGWIVFDESFKGFSGVENECALQILSKYANDKLIIVIEHLPEFTEMFNKVITIGYKEGVSKLENG